MIFRSLFSYLSLSLILTSIDLVEADATNDFIYPGPPVYVPSKWKVLTLGSTQKISWKTTAGSYNITLMQPNGISVAGQSIQNVYSELA